VNRECDCYVLRYLLLEDDETKDILIQLNYMKFFFNVNYSRKVNSLDNSMVILKGSELASQGRPLYWHWAFESPANVKSLIRKEIGKEHAPKVCLLHESCLAGATCNPLLPASMSSPANSPVTSRAAGPPLLGAAAHRVQCSGSEL
jgi:hypothetical protein